MTTILKPDGSYTLNINETMQVMLDHLIIKDDQTEDTEYHKRILKQTKDPILTADDRELTPAEVKNATENLTNKKAPGEDGIAGAIYKIAFELFPTLTYTIYNECLRTGCFPKKWKTSQNNSTNKTRQGKNKGRFKVQTNKFNKCRRQSPRENTYQQNFHYVYSNNLLNKNQFGFTPRKSTTDATLAVKDYIDEGIRQGHITILISLDVRGAFDAA